MQFYGLSDIGRVREANEDVWMAIPECNCFLLADGMGGHQAGEVAAAEAVKFMVEFVKKNLLSSKNSSSLTAEKASEVIKQGIINANKHLRQLGKKYGHLAGMGTTLCLLYFQGDDVICAHVGDSRVYLFRDDKLIQLTEDHSLAVTLFSPKELEGVRRSKLQHILTKALGTQSSVDPSVDTRKAAVNDLYLICSDGLHGYVSKEKIQDVLIHAPSLKEAGSELVNAANEEGGHDNVTVFLVKYSET